jgi:hypothetical protein
VLKISQTRPYVINTSDKPSAEILTAIFQPGCDEIELNFIGIGFGTAQR